jgi:thiosulfate dehydrogenase [quinone] large subunit
MRTPSSSSEIAYSLFRITFGVNIFLHGVMRLVTGHAAFLAYVTEQMQGAAVPSWFLPSFSYALPYMEGSAGLLLVLGLFTRSGLIAGTLIILLLQIGSCLAQNWSVAGDQLVYSLSFFILLSLIQRNRWSIDDLRGVKYGAPSFNPAAS